MLVAEPCHKHTPTHIPQRPSSQTSNCGLAFVFQPPCPGPGTERCSVMSMNKGPIPHCFYPCRINSSTSPLGGLPPPTVPAPRPHARGFPPPTPPSLLRYSAEVLSSVRAPESGEPPALQTTLAFWFESKPAWGLTDVLHCGGLCVSVHLSSRITYVFERWQGLLSERINSAGACLVKSEAPLFAAPFRGASSNNRVDTSALYSIAE